ncbi:uncharacterized protein LOC120527778 [Polypterus senegalus]|uniref:uncharacterized protein LOC120527778 n=1 Tax=Polypterus senegalus TaxID=55291 RepID=UPI00196443CC|nr:uncharacterized protein LOC120527778 [Polypterus senegalus]
MCWIIKDALQVFDETDTNVEEDIFQELVQSNPQICFTVKCPPQGLFADLDVSGATSTPSTCTDTLSNSSNVEELERTKLNLSASSNFNNGREITSAEKVKQIVQNALKEKPGGLDVLEEYELTKTLKHSTRRQLVNVLVSHMTEVHGRIPTLKQRETYALGIVSLFPARRDPYSSKGYVNQDFILLFNAETSAKLLEQWEMAFKPKVIEEAKSLTLTAELQSHISAAEKQQSEHGRKKVKIRPTDAVDRLVHFHKSCTSIEEHLMGRESHQSYLLAVGRTRKRIDNFYVVVDKQLIPCAGATSLSAIDELFKVHYVFNLTYEESLANVYTFLQTTVYNIDIGLTNESPRVRELRVKLLNNV